jgi:hypothetical protein
MGQNKSLHSRQTANEGWRSFSDPGATGAGAGLILLFDGEAGLPKGGPDESNQTGILTCGLSLAPAFPARLGADQWLEARGYRALELVTRHSGATVPESHRVPSHLAATSRVCGTLSKSETVLRRRSASEKENEGEKNPRTEGDLTRRHEGTKRGGGGKPQRTPRARRGG